ncbi:MAG: hypothetical protein DWQ21_09445 [Bacteroidetes bacterium]|nr:MAG: hypothetical protein DWQ21_09445 [Bacteroidota bacterium]REK57334.1 MAG: hypothetical protein DWQ49_09275 [Bacteroidota bacterium]
MSDKKLPFEKIFPYFSYRWRYEDGQYSPYAPFSKVNFFPKDPDVEDFFKKGNNTSMSNTVETINLGGIDRGGPDVVAVDILYRESISDTIYILKTIEIPADERGNGKFLKLQINKRSFAGALPNDQLTRAYDNVPLKAKSQEVTANRLIYGNYTHQFDQPDELRITLGQDSLPEPLNGPHIKGNRTYNVGVVYIDKYGRYGNLITQDAPTVSTEGSSIKTDFTTEFRNELTAKITSKAPSWAVWYRYFVKDVSGEHFNLSSFNVYNDGLGLNKSDNVYLQFNSTDRNKITEDTILIPRRHNFDDSENIFEGLSRHPVLEIENEAPDIVKSQIVERSFAFVTQFLEKNAQLRPTSVVNGQNDGTSDNFATTTVGQTTLVIEDERADGWNAIISAINTYVASQDPDETVRFEQKRNDGSSTSQSIDVSGYGDRLALKIVANKTQDEATYQTGFVLVDNIELMRINGDRHRNAFKFTLSNRVDEDGNVLTTTGLDKGGINMHSDGVSTDIRLSKLGLSEEGFDKIKGSFFVKVPREVVNNTDITLLPTGQSEFDDDGKVSNIREINFETEPATESNLNLYWETSDTFLVAKHHGQTNKIPFANCIGTAEPTTGKIYLESRKLFDKFNSIEIAKGTRVNTPVPRFAEETRKAGLIFSGLYNSKTGINELNQFNMALNPTKELEPNYGGIQKLFTLDTNLLAFAEDKVFRVLADKDALFNADDGVNVTATNLVLGQAMVYQGQYGISTHPESFAFWGNNAYFTDAKRGVVMQLTPANGQLFPISSRGMSNFFRDRIGSADKLIGAYDGAKKQYVLSMQGYDQNAVSIGSETIPNETSNITLGYSLRAEGWTSRFSFIPESGITMANRFYTFKNGKAYLHNSDTADRNNFYGTAANSEVQIIFNDNPTYISDFLTLNYEGDSNWEASEIIGDQDGIYSITNVRILDSDESGFLGWFLKEGKYHGSIVGTQPVYIIDPNGSVGADGFWPLIQDGANTQDISGTKGFFSKVRFKNSATTKKELFAISSEYYISQT